ncbi:MAG: UV DNA damage repair endonuclease UvsE [Candidatus Thermoplasmatota archaeon]|nr:UV DNA damage repair endonuclease UvsE [Candidatus Thermoplasmatota archaeon]
MKIGYPCINRTLPCRGNKTFRLKSYSKERFIDTVTNNLRCLQHLLSFNLDHNILFFRISSDIIPFASHSVLNVDWELFFKDRLQEIGRFIKKNNMRISMHPDQFIVLNSKRKEVVQRSIQELVYHASFLDSLGLDASSKIQLHVGGVYGEKEKSMNRFVKNFDLLPLPVKKRLVIENDDRSYTAKDCLQISKQIHIPVLFDVLHHQINNFDEPIQKIFRFIAETWQTNDGIPMVDYSSQEQNEKIGKHATHINQKDFICFLQSINSIDFDIMLEIKDKEKSALEAISLAKSDPRFIFKYKKKDNERILEEIS